MTDVPLDFNNVPRYQQLARILIEQIQSGELQPGMPIPSKRVIKQAYSVAGSTTDRAVDVLKDLGMVVFVPGLGLYVTERKHWRKDTGG